MPNALPVFKYRTELQLKDKLNIDIEENDKVKHTAYIV